MAPARQQPAPPPFSKDEKVLCFHMDMLYEAKVMDVQPVEKPGDGYRYKVHYKGWKNTWDDWVLVDRIRPFDDEHKELAAQLHAQLKHNMQRSTKLPKKGLRSGAESARVSEERAGSATVQGGRGGRRGKDWELEQCAVTLVRLPNTKALSTPAQKDVCRFPPPFTCIYSRHIGSFLFSFVSPTYPSNSNKHTFSVPFPHSHFHLRLPSSNPSARQIAVMPEAQPLAARKRPRTSNVRGSPRAPASKICLGLHSSKRVKVERLRTAPDHLAQVPKDGHRYVTATGKFLDDGRYNWPLDDKVGREKQPVKSIKAHKARASQEPCSRSNTQMEDAFHSKPMINLPVPDHIQAMLVDDWENITKNNQLVPLPHAKPVTKILEEYLAHEKPQREEGSANMDILEEVIAGFREYFEKALSRILLYRFERHQYMDVRKSWENADENSDVKGVCDVYGAEHLARLIVSLPELLAQTNMDQQSVSRLREEVGKFTVWLGKNCETYFVSEYETPSQEYIDKARSF
ncbi:hypothetical protein AK830_g2259 [Neonectria ditissima]|uniref:Chromatin modification-related protein EAF3 n=1 Tax=Neonectria ditissima TaxID=78410 RepID=A0A0P7BBS7_9HYPO|nr:hypothetical protein AK830_g2259 [Neonectria ditissima]